MTDRVAVNPIFAHTVRRRFCCLDGGFKMLYGTLFTSKQNFITHIKILSGRQCIFGKCKQKFRLWRQKLLFMKRRKIPSILTKISSIHTKNFVKRDKKIIHVDENFVHGDEKFRPCKLKFCQEMKNSVHVD